MKFMYNKSNIICVTGTQTDGPMDGKPKAIRRAGHKTVKTS